MIISKHIKEEKVGSNQQTDYKSSRINRLQKGISINSTVLLDFEQIMKVSHLYNS